VRNGESTSFRSRPDGTINWKSHRGYSSTGNLADPFAINPIRRSGTLVAGCGATITVPWLFSEQIATTIMLSVGWLAMTGLVIGLPVLVLSLIEEAVRLIRRKIRPTVDLLDLTPRLTHILVRHGYDAIDDVDRAPDAALLLLSNMDARGVQAIRRAVALWKYQRWQEQGFPVTNQH
jgi:hypothetical protein